MQDDQISAKKVIYLFLGIMIVVGGIYFYLQRRKENRQIDLAAAYTCALMQSLNENKDAFLWLSPNKPTPDSVRNMSLGDFSDMISGITGAVSKNKFLENVKQRYGLSDEEFQNELKEIGVLMRQNAEFKKKSGEKLTEYNRQFKCI